MGQNSPVSPAEAEAYANFTGGDVELRMEEQ